MEPVKLASDLTDGLQELKNELLAALEGAQALTIDAGRVRRVSTPSLELMVAAVRAADERGRPTSWVHVSRPFRDAAERLGFAKALHLSPAESGA